MKYKEVVGLGDVSVQSPTVSPMKNFLQSSFLYLTKRKSCNSVNYRILLSLSSDFCGAGGNRTLVQTRKS